MGVIHRQVVFKIVELDKLAKEVYKERKREEDSD